VPWIVLGYRTIPDMAKIELGSGLIPGRGGRQTDADWHRFNMTVED
jgi:hypothetical protein